MATVHQYYTVTVRKDCHGRSFCRFCRGVTFKLSGIPLAVTQGIAG